MANTLHSRSAASASSSPSFLKIHPSGQVETIMSPKNGNGKPSQAIKDKIEVAEKHFVALGAEQVFEHNLCVLKAAADGKLLDLHASERDVLSMELVDQILYHSLKSDSYLPTDAQFSKRFGSTFELQRRLNDLDSEGGDRCSAYVQLLNDPSNDLTDLLIALYTRIADMMAVHDPRTVMASKTKMPGVFPVVDWKSVQVAWADPMLKVYCRIADWGGQTYAYRQMRDNAIYYRHPRLFQRIAAEVEKRRDALGNTNKFIFEVLRAMARRLNLQLIVAKDYRTVSKVFSEIGPRTVAVALKPFKGIGGLLAKSLEFDGLPVERIHDWVAATAITETERQTYTVASFLHEEGMKSTAAAMGVPDVHICKPKDYIAEPKPVTLYQSVHTDLARWGVAGSQPGILCSEFITRPLPKHIWADEGGASPAVYKDSHLRNGERERLMQRFAEITASAH